MTSLSEIHKAAGLIIRDRKVLVSRSKGKETFVQPGGKIEAGETPEQALVRELKEEQGAEVSEDDLEYVGTFHAIAAGHEAEQIPITLHAYIVAYDGPLEADNEIEEDRWIASEDAGNLNLGSIMEHDILPLLKIRGLID